MENIKRCTKCGIEKPLSEFSCQKKLSDGKKKQCKSCDREYKKKYYADNRGRILAYQATYSQDNPDVGRRAKRKYRVIHADRVLESARRREAAHPEKRVEYRKKAKEENPLHILYMQTKSRANKSGIPFTIEEVDLFVPNTCPVLGIPLRWERGRRSPNTPSIDRMLPHLGYVPGNVAIISWRANRLKNDGEAWEHHKIGEWMDKKLSLSLVA